MAVSSVVNFRVGLHRAGPILLRQDTRSPTIEVEFPADFHLGAVAHGLSQLNRFAGQTPRPYSVGEHSIRLARVVRGAGFPPGHQRAALLHDAPECLGVGDHLSGLKTPLAAAYRPLENTTAEWLWRRYGDSVYAWRHIEDDIKPYDKEIGDYEFYTFGLHNGVGEVPAFPAYLPFIPTTHANTSQEVRRLWVREWINAGGIYDGPEEYR